MGDRDRLIELIRKQRKFCNNKNCGSCGYAKFGGYPDCQDKMLAHNLIENGVIAPPCKVGDKVYIVKSRTSDDKNLYIIEDVVKRIVFDKSEDTGFIHSRIEFINTSSISDWLFQNIFLTREEAEKALERSKGNAEEKE